jgi:hypothetical protein
LRETALEPDNVDRNCDTCCDEAKRLESWRTRRVRERAREEERFMGLNCNPQPERFQPFHVAQREWRPTNESIPLAM